MTKASRILHLLPIAHTWFLQETMKKRFQSFGISMKDLQINLAFSHSLIIRLDSIHSKKKMLYNFVLLEKKSSHSGESVELAISNTSMFLFLKVMKMPTFLQFVSLQHLKNLIQHLWSYLAQLLEVSSSMINRVIHLQDHLLKFVEELKLDSYLQMKTIL